MSKTLFVGVDLGGTNVKTGLVTGDGEVLARDERKTLARESAEAPVKQIADSIVEVVRAGGVGMSDIRGIGIGSPGPLSAKKGMILRAGNLPHWENFPLAAIIKDRLGPNVYIQNDATVFAYGEWWMGAGRGRDDFYVVTLGTGIGGGSVSGGKLVTGFNDNANEIGHTTIDYNGPQCWCGQRGCLELYSSATGLVRMTNEAVVNEHIETSLAGFRNKPGEMTSKHIYEAAVAGDDFARHMLDTAGYLLGVGLLNALNFFNYEVVAIGGGLGRAGDLIIEPARRAFRERGFQSYIDEVSIVPAEIPDIAAILGAARLAIDKERGN